MNPTSPGTRRDGPSNKVLPISLRRIEERSGNLRQPVTYGFLVRPSGDSALVNFRVIHEIPERARFVGALPAPAVHGRKLIWTPGDLGPGEELRFVVRILPEPGCELPREATAVLETGYLLKT